jgi:hypothetical protein
MNSCKYWDCGWCYAPDDVETSASSQSACFDPDYCPYLKSQSQMTEIEKTEGEIKVLQAKLELLKGMENHISPVEEAYKDWMGVYPPTNPSVDNIFDIRWRAFQMGYNAAYEEKVAQEPEEEPEELKTLYQMFFDNEGAYGQLYYDDALRIVKRWMSQYTHNAMTGEYLKGYEECLIVLEENLK